MSTQDTVNIVLLRRIGFFALFNPKTKKVFNCNIYRVCCVLVTFIIECLTVYGMIGLFVETEGKLDNVNLSNLLVYYQVNILCLVEISTFIYRAEDIWHLYKVTGVNFLTNRRSRQHKHILYEYREVSIMATNYLCKFLVLAVSAWILYPQLLNFNTFTGVHDIDITKTKRFYNVFDIRFPVTTRTYNDYYYLFYLIEVFMVTSMGYLFVMFNTMFISFSFVLMAQYEIVANDFASIGDEHTNPDDRKMTVIGAKLKGRIYRLSYEDVLLEYLQR
ncbi:Hypothetical protein CINCED_3A011837 [Cinara cedri]|uniref:Olfactory receptor, insect n=1 Tax=Cinara cedri TaxID=506608 RepID=A0A5E4NDE8_9HEMI|nr:Hypothetical protein CINCED_3A011837 [Cinara cedri]